jgi:hypothetical protein
VNDGVAFFAPGFFLVVVMLGGSVVLWLVAAVYVWFKEHQVD